MSSEQVCIVVASDTEGRITANEIDKAFGSHLSDDVILCTDHATNYKNFAIKKGLEHKTLNASKKQRVVEKVYHIQHVNSDHSRLEDWINRRFKGVATKYMDNYLAWLKFLEISRDMDKNTRKKTFLLQCLSLIKRQQLSFLDLHKAKGIDNYEKKQNIQAYYYRGSNIVNHFIYNGCCRLSYKYT
ncbi:MAG: IS1595 family transposase [Firmicutes bacterium]|nr:IS1595 family transposase [Bacillota bacterium]